MAARTFVEGDVRCVMFGSKRTPSCGLHELRSFLTAMERVPGHAAVMSLPEDADQFLRRLSATSLPCAVEGFESIDLIRTLLNAPLLQAILPPGDEASRRYSGQAWVVRLTQDGIDEVAHCDHPAQS